MQMLCSGSGSEFPDNLKIIVINLNILVVNLKQIKSDEINTGTDLYFAYARETVRD